MKVKELLKLDHDDMIKYLLVDIRNLFKVRGQSENAIEGIFREQLNKWQKICESNPNFDRYHFDEVLNYYYPKEWLLFCQISEKKWKDKQKKNIRLHYEQEKKQLEKTPEEVRGFVRLALLIDKIEQEREIDELWK